MKGSITASIAFVMMVICAVFSGSISSEYEGETKVVTVDSTNLRFSPATITVKEGDSVRFFWSGELLPHNAVEDFGLFDTGEPSTEVDYTYTFSFGENGTYQYFCEPHEDLGMIGTIIVEPNPDLVQNNSEEPNEEEPTYESQNGGFNFTFFGLELIILFAIGALIYQVGKIRSFGDTELAKISQSNEEMEAEILE